MNYCVEELVSLGNEAGAIGCQTSDIPIYTAQVVLHVYAKLGLVHTQKTNTATTSLSGTQTTTMQKVHPSKSN